MIFQPPIGIQFIHYTVPQIVSARAGVCPHCHTQTLEPKHTCEAIQFKQCTGCEVVVALEKT